ncbi:MAG: hypothetical protein NUW00_04915 [Candidatus Kaiserbacteria bacterium]|nr:hypothetical protein [Candidatus Kaiserbacteria bacterium]MCR4330917.1 hypothetical protein [Patescibacteria group bacterium]
MVDRNTTGTMMLTTYAAVTLFECEIKGQMSDGNWENATPHDHWKFWCSLDTVLGAQNRIDIAPGYSIFDCKRVSYGLTRLIKFIGARMIAQGRLATALNRRLSCHEGWACANMPADLVSWRQQTVNNEKSAMTITDEMALAYYSTVYLEKDLKEDLKHISCAIKSVKLRHPYFSDH